MNKKILLSTLFALLLITSLIPVALGTPPSPTDTTTLVIDTIGEPETVDPACGYYSASSEVIQNVYEPLSMYMVDRRNGPYEAGLVDQFTPRVAKSWQYDPVGFAPYVDSVTGLTIQHRFYFEIRVGIPFHYGWGALTTEDVEYSFERMMVQDRDGGPQWMVYEYLLNAYGASDPMDDPLWGTKIDHAIEHDATQVWFNIASNFPEVTIMQINAYCGGIVCKDWAVSLGDFDGDWAGHTWQYIWDTWHNPSTSYIEYDEARPETKPVGTGPYQFSYWNHGSSWSITKFNGYWDGWPSKVIEDPVNPGGSYNRIVDYITTVTWFYYPAWISRLSRFLTGGSDMTDVPETAAPWLSAVPGIRCYCPLDLLSLQTFFFTFDITTTSPYVPTFYPSGQFGTNGIPVDLFSDVNVRRGFAYAFNYAAFILAVYLGAGTQPSDPVIAGIPYDNPAQAKYAFNLNLAEYYLKLAWGGVDSLSGIPGVPVVPEDPARVTPGALWNGGMKFTIPYNYGNVGRQLAAAMITTNINSLNPLFQLSPSFAVWWGSSYLPQMVNSEIPIFFNGWLADYPDPHNMVHPFMHSQGVFATWQKYNNPVVDANIALGIATPNGPLRQLIYYGLQALYHDDAPSVPIVQSVGHHFERDWMRGWYYHPTAQNNYHHFYKAKTHFGDANNDGTVNLIDKGYISSHWTLAGMTYNPSADLSGGTGCRFGTIALVVGIPDGKIDIIDLAVVSAYWD